MQFVWTCLLLMVLAVGVAPGQATNPGGLGRLSDANKALLDKVTAWVKENNRFGPEHRIVTDVSTKVGTVLSKDPGFCLTLGGGLVKGNKPVVLGGYGGELFVLEVPDEQKKSLTVAELGVDLQSVFGANNEPAEPHVKLADLVVENALQLDGSKKITGSVRCKLLKDIPGTAMVRLVCVAGDKTRTYTADLAPPLTANTAAINFNFPPLNDDKIQHRGPMLVFLDVGSVVPMGPPQEMMPRQTKVRIVSTPVAILTFIKEAGPAGLGKDPLPSPRPPSPGQPTGNKTPKQTRDPLASKIVEWPGGTYATFDGWGIAELPNDLQGKLYLTTPPGDNQEFALLLFVVTPPPEVLARMFDLGPTLVKRNFPHLERVGKPEQCKFGGDDARLERYTGKRKNRHELAQGIFIRKKDVAVIVFGIGTEAGFNKFGRATEIVAQSLSFKESPLERELVGTWTFSNGLRREFRVGERINVSKDITLTIYPNGTFTEYSQGYVDSVANAGGYRGSMVWVKEGGGRGRIVKRGDVLTFQYDDGKVWSGPYTLKGNNGLELGGSLYTR